MNADLGQQVNRLDTHGVTATNTDEYNMFGLKNGIDDSGENALIK